MKELEAIREEAEGIIHHAVARYLVTVEGARSVSSALLGLLEAIVRFTYSELYPLTWKNSTKDVQDMAVAAMVKKFLDKTKEGE